MFIHRKEKISMSFLLFKRYMACPEKVESSSERALQRARGDTAAVGSISSDRFVRYQLILCAASLFQGGVCQKKNLARQPSATLHAAQKGSNRNRRLVLSVPLEEQGGQLLPSLQSLCLSCFAAGLFVVVVRVLK